jgi:hypothetical protein
MPHDIFLQPRKLRVAKNIAQDADRILHLHPNRRPRFYARVGVHLQAVRLQLLGAFLVPIPLP